MSKTPPRTPAWMPTDYSSADVSAMQALAMGTANEGQQRRALDWIIKNAGGAYEQSFRSDADGGDRETAFAEGRRYVALQVVKLINMSGSVIDALRKTEGPMNG